MRFYQGLAERECFFYFLLLRKSYSKGERTNRITALLAVNIVVVFLRENMPLPYMLLKIGTDGKIRALDGMASDARHVSVRRLAG